MHPAAQRQARLRSSSDANVSLNWQAPTRSRGTVAGRVIVSVRITGSCTGPYRRRLAPRGFRGPLASSSTPCAHWVGCDVGGIAALKGDPRRGAGPAGLYVSPGSPSAGSTTDGTGSDRVDGSPGVKYRGGRTRTCNPRFWRRAVLRSTMPICEGAPHFAPHGLAFGHVSGPASIGGEFYYHCQQTASGRTSTRSAAIRQAGLERLGVQGERRVAAGRRRQSDAEGR